MDWSVVEWQERAAVQRIAALLFALADLCDLASARSLPVRAFVLWLLRPAEFLARNYIMGEDEAAGTVPAGNTPEDAARLAQALHDLACALQLQAACAFGETPRQGGPAFSLRDFARRLAASLDGAAWRVVGGPDTS